MSSKTWKSVRTLDNFYQTSSFYPMPVILITTVSESGETNIGPYSLVFPFGIADAHAMMLISRASSNTAINIRRTKQCALNFIPYNKKLLKDTVRLGFPGQTTEEKLKETIFTLIKTDLEKDGHPFPRPEIIKEAIQVFECTWDDSADRFYYSGDRKTPDGEEHFLLDIDRILIEPKLYEYLLNGKGFPNLPIDYGFRDNTNFWFAEHKKPYAEPLPRGKGTRVEEIYYQANRIDPDIKFTHAACEKIVAVPRIFLKRVLTGIILEAKERGITEVTPELMDQIRDKRNKEKRP